MVVLGMLLSMQMILREAKVYLEKRLDKKDKTSTKMSEELDKILKKSKKDTKNKLLFDFVNSTCSLAWQMTLQQPPMLWETNGVDAKTDENIQEIVPVRDMDIKKMEHGKVKYYLEPALVQGDNIFVKGRVLIHWLESAKKR